MQTPKAISVLTGIGQMYLLCRPALPLPARRWKTSASSPVHLPLLQILLEGDSYVGDPRDDF
jgi:hypothetical protein